jgi:hypothetical protein
VAASKETRRFRSVLGALRWRYAMPSSSRSSHTLRHSGPAAGRFTHSWWMDAGRLCGGQGPPSPYPPCKVQLPCAGGGRERPRPLHPRPVACAPRNPDLMRSQDECQMRMPMGRPKLKVANWCLSIPEPCASTVIVRSRQMPGVWGPPAHIHVQSAASAEGRSAQPSKLYTCPT